MSLVDAIARAASKREIYYISQAKVESVDESSRTARVSFTDGRPVKEVRLCPTKDASSYFIPAVKSSVAVAFMENAENRGFICSYTKIDKVVFAIGDSFSIENEKGKIALSKDGVSLGDGSHSQLLGETVQTWAQDVDLKIQAILTWAATGVAPGPQGGINPLTGILPTSFPDGALSEVNKTS